MALTLLRHALQNAGRSLFNSRTVSLRHLSSLKPGVLGDEEYGKILDGFNISSKDSVPIEEAWRTASMKFATRNTQPHSIYAGRSVTVRDGNIAGASAILERVLAQNQVKAEWRRAKRHIPKGEQRRKLISVRWRRRFKAEVKQKVRLALQIRRRNA